MSHNNVEINAKKGKRLIQLFTVMETLNFLAKCCFAALLIGIFYLLGLTGDLSSFLIVPFVFSFIYILGYKIYFSSIKVIWFIFDEVHYIGIYHKNRATKCWELMSLHQSTGFFIRAEIINISSDFEVVRDIDCVINETLEPIITITFEAKDKEQFIRSLVNRDFHEIHDLIGNMQSDLKARVDSFLQFFNYEKFETIDAFMVYLRSCLNENGAELNYEDDLQVVKVAVEYDCNIVTMIMKFDPLP